MKKISRCFKKIIYDVIKFSGWPIMYLWFRPKFYYEDPKLQKNRIKGPAVIICNHRKWFDSALIILTFMGRRIRFLAASEKSVFWSKTLELVGGINIDRRKVDLDGIRATIKIIKDGGVVTVYPEGMLVTNSGMDQFKDGAALIALRANVPVIVVYIEEKTSFWQRKKIIISKPIDYHVDETKEIINITKIHELTQVLKDKMDGLALSIEKTREFKSEETVPHEIEEEKKSEKRTVL